MKKLLVLLIILVLPVSAMALTIGDVNLNKLGNHADVIRSGNTVIFFVLYPEPIKIVQIITTFMGGSNYNVDILKYFKDGELYVWESNDTTKSYDRREDLKDNFMLRKIFDDYLGKLSMWPKPNDPTDEYLMVAKYPTGGGNKYPNDELLVNDGPVSEESHIDLKSLTEDMLVGHQHFRSRNGQICKQTFRYDIPINLVQVFMEVNNRTGQSILMAWRYFKDGEFFLFALDMDIYQKFGRTYYTRRPVELKNLPEIRAEFDRFKNPI